MTGSLLTVKSPLNTSCLPSLLKPATPVEVIPLAQGQSLGTLKIPRFRSNRNAIRKRESQEWLPSTRNQGNASGAHLNESPGSRAPAKPVLIIHDSCLTNPTPPPISHHRSKSRRRRDRSSSDTGRDSEEQPSIIDVEHRGGRSKDRQEDKNRIDPSTHSYVRRSRRSSVESAGRERVKISHE